ncbi:MAG TPA: excinuclease ABC subunit UvrC [Candidatus Thermoplasmatota archaeon]|nr:excinuclease ABC subunit UvrC [Candidatus Thermoplasmatota archaeon]
MVEVMQLPTNPGCYLFRDKDRTIIYVGKAKNIRKRVSTYFQRPALDPKTQLLIHSIASVDYIVTNTEVEAFILENTLIKRHQPKYNINLKDAKSYAFIQVTDETFPRLLIARGKPSGPGRFYGPFVSGQERDYVLQFLNRTLALRTCRRLPKRACLRYHIHVCDAPCIGCINAEDYGKKIHNAQLILSGKTQELLKQLEHGMHEHSKRQEFEKALLLRNQQEAIAHLQERQTMQRQISYDEDVVNYLVRNDTVYLMLFNVYKGTLSQKNEFVFDASPEFLEEFLVQYYSENLVPSEVIVPTRTTESVAAFLASRRKKKVTVLIPQKGPKKRLLDLVLKNIEITFFGDLNKVEELKAKLQLQDAPLIIECFDISHLSGTSTVGSLVQFRNGKPDKSNYRRFRIRTVEGIDDVAAIAEVVRRRYTRIKEENSELPHLIVVDGGRGQLNAAVHELERLGLKTPVISIAKHFEEVYVPGRMFPLRMDRREKALQFIQEIRDEAHRFAIAYNRLLRKKELRS